MRIVTRGNIAVFLVCLMVAFTGFGVYSATAYRKALNSVSLAATFEEGYYDYASFLPREEDRYTIDRDFGGGNSSGLDWRAAGDSTVEFTLDVPEAGDYTLTLEYAPLNAGFEQNLFDLSVNGAAPGVETSNIRLPAFYRFSRYDFEKNSRGNDMYPEQIMLSGRQRLTVRAGSQAYQTDALLLPLEGGTCRFTMTMNEGAVRLYVAGLKKLELPPPSYADYFTARPGVAGKGFTLIEAEKYYYKNKSSITVVNSPAYTASPYSTLAVELNAIDPKTYQEHLDTLTYFAEIEQAGYYTLGIKTTMPGKTASPVFMDIEIDGKIPFAEFHSLRLEYHRFMANHLFEEYPVYLEPGIHEFAFIINGTVYHEMSGRLRSAAEGINELSLALKKITGNNQDRDREWIIEEFLPDMVPSMERWKETLEGVAEDLLALSGGKSNEEVSKLRVALRQLQKLIDEPNKVPYRMTVLSEGERSILQSLSQSLLTITAQSLGLDQIIIAGERASVSLPVVKTNVFFGLAETIRQLASSYKETTPGSDTDAIDVWVLRTRQYADVIQSLTDERFTPASGIRVNFSLITDQGKLTLANAAGRQPDAVLGVDQFYVNDLAVRGSLTDLRRFSRAEETVKHAAPGALIQMIIDEKLYGLPESQNFHLLFYRSDIFNAFGWDVPETWDEVLLMLPALVRNGMGFYIPLSSPDAFKSWPYTMPFYAQFGAKLYAQGTGNTLIDSDEGVAAMKFMANLFKLYGLPLQVASFYNEFRSGRIPLGVADLGEYTRLSFSAPEIAGRWSVAMIPGRDNGKEVVEHWSASPSKAVCIFEASNKKEAAWEFLRWWLSEETQVLYTRNMQNRYGQEFLWISGNMEALKQLPVPEDHRRHILAQTSWLQDAPRIPGGYYTEREVSNAFNRVIYDGVDVRSSIDEASVATNREIRRKMEEFGYRDADGVIRDYIVPSIEGIERWFDEEEYQ
jgi:ABC-type glycerol-3-phosphate transport system substrate-binding protein